MGKTQKKIGARPASAGLDVEFLKQVIAEGGEDSRKLLALQVAGLLRDTESPAIEREQIVPIALSLAQDELAEVRSILATELVEAAALPAELVFAIASDDEVISRPFLETARSLTWGYMLAILKAGDEQRQCIIAKRPDLSSEARNHIVKISGAAVVLTLMDNSTQTLAQPDYFAIYERLGSQEAIIERLLRLPELPPEIRVTQSRRVASRMLQLMAEKEWLNITQARDLTSDAEETALQKIVSGTADPQASVALMQFLGTKNLLTPSLIVRAAAVGDMTAVEKILGHLAGLTPERTNHLLYHKGASGFRSVFSKSGLPASCQGILQAACDVTRETREEDYRPTPAAFGKRVLEALMTRYEDLAQLDRARQIEYLSRYGEDQVRRIARRLKSDLARAAA